MYSVEILGTGSCVPEHRVSNTDLSAIVDTSDEWISKMTGIKERRITKGENTTDLAVASALKALEDARISAEEIDLIIVSSATPDYFFPSTACLVQDKIGAAKAMSFDISAACTGFIYALNIAEQFIKTGVHKTALVIGAEVLSKITDWEDRNTCVLFADGAGAAILRRGKEGLLSGIMGADGSGAEYLECPAIPVGNKFTDQRVGKKPNFISMNGREVFKFAVNVIPECIQKVLDDSGYTIDQVKHIIPHQANVRIIDSAAKKLQVDKEKFYMNIQKYGNTSGASIPLALDEMSKEGLLNPGDLIIIVGFGAGLTYGAQLIRWTKE